jgi:glutathione S-transferase
VPHTLYVINGSHPCVCAERALQLKRQPYRVVEYVPALHVPMQWRRFGALTVPGLELGSGERIVGSRAIVHRLDALVPDPPLLPADAEARARVVEAERWGDEVLQPIPRRLVWAGIRRRPDASDSYADGSKLPVPAPLRRLVTPPISRVAAWRNGATPAQARDDVAALRGHLDRIDGWIADGTLGGEQPNAADLQIAPAVRLLGTFADLRPLLDGRPAWALAQRLFPVYPGAMPAGTLPAAA